MLTAIFQFFLLTAAHPFYVGITSVDYNKEAKRVEISCRMFYDDFEVELKAGDGKDVDLINPKDRAATDSLLSKYIRSHFRLAVDGKVLELRYLGYEIEDDVAWCFLEAVNIASVSKITVDNRLLFDQFPKQSNILHVTANGKRKSTKLDNPERRAVFEW